MTQQSVPDPLPAGYKLHDRYLIEAALPPQRFGPTYRALDTVLNERVAINVLSLELGADARPEFRLCFRRAFKANPGRVHEYGECLGVAFAVVAYSEDTGAAIDVGTA